MRSDDPQGAPAPPGDFIRLQAILREGASALEEYVVRLGSDYGDLGDLRELAEAGTTLMLSVPFGQLPTELPAEMKAKLDTIPLPDLHTEDGQAELRHAVFHSAFSLVGKFLTERAFAANVDKGVLTQWLRVLREMERLVLEYRTTWVRDQKISAKEEERYFAARAMQSIVDDPVVDLAVASSLLALDGNPPQPPATERPEWLDEPNAQITVLIARSQGEVSSDLHIWPSQLPDQTLAAIGGRESVLLVPTSRLDDALTQLQTVFAEHVLVVGLPVTVTDIGQSLSWDRRAYELYRRNQLDAAITSTIESGRPIYCAELLPELIIGADESLLELAYGQIVAPLKEVTVYRKNMLIETLAAWSRRPQAGAPLLARHLGLHPQTVRYRLRQLHEVYGENLDDDRLMLLTSLVLHLNGNQHDDTA